MQQGVGADGHELALRERAFHDLRELLVQQRLAAGEHDDRRAALVDRANAVLDRQPLIQDLVRVVDLAASRTREVAAKQRLEHQHERIALAPTEVLSDDIGTDRQNLI